MLRETTVQTANVIDQTLLRPDATVNDVEVFCKSACAYPFASVCVHPVWIKSASSFLQGTGIGVCSVAGFPSGAHRTDVKIMESKKALEDGAREIDAVINLGLMKQKLHTECLHELEALARACHEQGAIVKIIIETCLLSDKEKRAAAELVIESGCDFIKTSTGFGAGGAVPEDVHMLAEMVKGTGVKVKAAGGIHTLKDLSVMRKAGAHRIGTSRGIAIIQETLNESTH